MLYIVSVCVRARKKLKINSGKNMVTKFVTRFQLYLIM